MKLLESTLPSTLMCLLSVIEEDDFTGPVMCNGPVRETEVEAEIALLCGVGEEMGVLEWI